MITIENSRILAIICCVLSSMKEKPEWLGKLSKMDQNSIDVLAKEINTDPTLFSIAVDHLLKKDYRDSNVTIDCKAILDKYNLTEDDYSLGIVAAELRYSSVISDLRGWLISKMT